MEKEHNKTKRLTLAGYRSNRTQTVFAVWVLSPVFAYLVTFFIIPIIGTFLISFQYWNALDPKHSFVGLENYQWNLRDPVFWQSLRNTLYYTIGYVLSTTLLGLVLALWINSIRREFGRIAEALFFLPVVISWAIASLLFAWIYQPSYGILNYYLGKVGLGPYRWLSHSSTVMPSIILMSVWKTVGYAMVILRAGLLSIPETFYEAAKIDGARKWQVFRKITLPLLQPSLLLVTVTNVIWSLQVFTQVYIMTGGGPGTSSSVLVFRMYQLAFKFFQMDRGTSLAVILFLMIMAVTILQVRLNPGGFRYYYE
jgi:ABC-type sugar transport system permease subunit